MNTAVASMKKGASLSSNATGEWLHLSILTFGWVVGVALLVSGIVHRSPLLLCLDICLLIPVDLALNDWPHVGRVL